MIDGKQIQDVNVEEILKGLEADESELGDAVQEIEAKIPDAASDENQLADKAFVASSVDAVASSVTALAAKVPNATLPTSAGSYKLVVSVSEDVVTYTWEALA